MKSIYIIFIIFMSSNSYADSTQGNISATVSQPPATLNSDGTLSNAPVLYCEQNNTEIMCYF